MMYAHVIAAVSEGRSLPRLACNAALLAGCQLLRMPEPHMVYQLAAIVHTSTIGWLRVALVSAATCRGSVAQCQLDLTTCRGTTCRGTSMYELHES
jgi:hypothetical protein